MSQEWRLVLHRNPEKLTPMICHQSGQSGVQRVINSNVQINQLCVESLNIFPLSSLFLDLQLYFRKKVQKRPIMLKLHVCWLA